MTNPLPCPFALLTDPWREGCLVVADWSPLARILYDLAVNLLAHWPLVLALAVLVAGMLGWIGKGVGLHHLFRDDDEVFGGIESEYSRPAPPKGLHWLTASPAFWSGFGLAITTGLIWLAMHTGTPRAGSGSLQIVGPGGAIRWCSLVLLGLVLVGSVALSRRIAVRYMGMPRSDGKDWPPDRQEAEIRRATLGGLAGAGMVVLVLAAALWLPQLVHWLLGSPEGWVARPCIWIALLPYLIFVGRVFWRPNALPCVSIFCLVILMVLVFGLAGWLAGVAGEVAAIVALIWLVRANGAVHKYRLPGFGPLYEAMQDPASPEAGRHGRLIAPVAALNAWKRRVTGNAPWRKPILVLVATSGGAYRATFWTSLILDHLITESARGRRWPGLADNIRLVTGASGGMVAGAYLAAMAAEGRLSGGLTRRLIDDTRNSLAEKSRRRYPLGRDSLSPLVHQMVRRDLWHPLRPGHPDTDRGRVLDAQWPTLATNFTALRRAEAEGRAPSLILSPMLVETGAVALFSNLDLHRIRARAAPRDEVMAPSVEIFRQFRRTQTAVTLATATRLSATFPYLSPAISLPATGGRRLVDAGYYDNYGVDLATGFLEEATIHNWIAANCAGVAVIEIRAFPTQPLVAPPGRIARAFQFLTSPVEGLMNARQGSQIFRNTQQLRTARDRFASATGDRNFLKVFTFEACCKVSLSWYLRLDEVRAIACLLEKPEPAEVTQAKKRREDEGDDWNAALIKEKPEAVAARNVIQREAIAHEFDALGTFWAERGGRSWPRRA